MPATDSDRIQQCGALLGCSERFFMRYVTHDSVEFEIPDDWLHRAGLTTAVESHEHFTSYPSGTVLDIASIASPVRNLGVRWFQEERMLRILDGIANNQPLPPIDVDQPPAGTLPYRVRDGLHRYYASVAAGFPKVPVKILPYFDINAG